MQRAVGLWGGLVLAGCGLATEPGPTSGAGGASSGPGPSSGTTSSSDASSSGSGASGGGGAHAGGGGASASSSTGSGGAAVPPCAPGDGFDDPGLPMWSAFADNNCSYQVQGSEFVIQLGGAGYVGAEARQAVAIHECAVTLEVPAVLDTLSGAASTYLDLPWVDSGHHASIYVSADRIYGEAYDDGGLAEVQGRPYNAANDRFWRIREQAGSLHFETSKDGVTYVELLVVATPPRYASPQIPSFGAGTSGPGPQTGSWTARMASFDE